MNRICNFVVAGLMVATATMAAPLNQVRAQSPPEPAVVISLADFTQQMGDVDYLVEASGFGQMKFMAQTMIKQYTKGINSKSPAGILLYFQENAEVPDFLGFVPVSNLDDLLDTIAGMAEVDEGDDFIRIVTDDGKDLLIKQVGDNAFFSNKKAMFDDLPSNPVELLGEMPAKYNLSAQVFGQRVPQKLRDQAIEAIRDGYEMQLEQMDDDEALQAELQRKNFEMQMEQFESWLNETDNLVIGMCADKDTQSLYTDVTITALGNSNLAEKFLAYAPHESSMFKGFLMEGAAFTANSRMNISELEIKQYQEMIDQLKEAALAGIQEEEELSESDAKVAEKALTSLVEIIKETIAEGKMDTGALVMLEDRNINFAAGLRLADPKKLEATLKDLVAFAEEKIGDDIQVDLNSGSFQGVTYHQAVFQVPEDEDDTREYFGDQLTIIVGIGQKAVYIGAGTNPLQTLNNAIKGAGTAGSEVLPDADAPLLQYNIHVAPILEFAAGLEGEPIVEKMAAELAANGRDRIKVISNTVENGIFMRFEMQDGILALIKVAMENFGAGGFPGGENDF